MKITFQASDFEGNEYIDIRDCPIARALRREGVTINFVGGFSWTDAADRFHLFNKVGNELANKLSQLSPEAWSATDNPFIGKSFEITDD